MTQTAAPTQTFHQPTPGTAASPVVSCGTCNRGIARQNGGSALWIDSKGQTTCPPKPVATEAPVLFPAEIHVRKLDIATGVRLDAFDDLTRPEGTIALNEGQAEMLMRDLARTLGFTVTRTEQPTARLTTPVTAADLRVADTNTVSVHSAERGITVMPLGKLTWFIHNTLDGDFEFAASELNRRAEALDAGRDPRV